MPVARLREINHLRRQVPVERDAMQHAAIAPGDQPTLVTDERLADVEFFCERSSGKEAAACSECDGDAALLRLRDGELDARRKLKVKVEQRAIQIKGDETNRCLSYFNLTPGTARNWISTTRVNPA